MQIQTVAFLFFLIALLSFTLFIVCTKLLTHGIMEPWIDRQRFPLVTEICVDLLFGVACVFIAFALMDVVAS